MSREPVRAAYRSFGVPAAAPWVRSHFHLLALRNARPYRTPTMTESASPVKYLIVGKTGWIANMVAALLKERGESYAFASFRLEQREACERELDTVRPQRVLNCAGVTGRPNVDWCEDHKRETIRSNVVGVLTLADCCAERGIHLTNFATGCIYHYDDGKHRYVSEHGGGDAAHRLRQCAHAASAHAHQRRLITAQLHHQDQQVRARGERAQQRDRAHRTAAGRHQHERTWSHRRVQLHQSRQHHPQSGAGAVPAVHRPALHLEELHPGGAGQNPQSWPLQLRAGRLQATARQSRL
eukprot:ctg_1175.g369